jgi:hypothetical protein
MMSMGGSKPHPSLMPDAILTDLEQSWRDRETEAILLISGGFLAMGIVLRLYSLEIRIKCIICNYLKLEFLPKVCKTHDLSELIIFSGLWKELGDPANGDLRTNWDILASFSKMRLNDVRYQPSIVFDPRKFAELSAALDDPTHGVISWLSKHP